jgi:hypothetical protein
MEQVWKTNLLLMSMEMALPSPLSIANIGHASSCSQKKNKKGEYRGVASTAVLAFLNV